MGVTVQQPGASELLLSVVVVGRGARMNTNINQTKSCLYI
jgi:hypothetical protein